MANDNVTPISPTVAARTSGPGRADLLKTRLDNIAERVQKQRERIFDAMGIISCAQHAAPQDVALDEPDLHRGLRAAYAMLNDVCTELDPTVLESGEVQP